MSWTAEITAALTGTKGEAKATVQYSNGVKTFSETYQGFTADGLKQTIVNRVAQLDKAETEVVAIEVGAVDTTPKPVEPPKTPVIDAKKIAFLAAYRKLLALKQAIDLGVIDANDADYVQAKADAIANYSGDYLGNP